MSPNGSGNQHSYSIVVGYKVALDLWKPWGHLRWGRVAFKNNFEKLPQEHHHILKDFSYVNNSAIPTISKFSKT